MGLRAGGAEKTGIAGITLMMECLLNRIRNLDNSIDLLPEQEDTSANDADAPVQRRRSKLSLRNSSRGRSSESSDKVYRQTYGVDGAWLSNLLARGEEEEGVLIRLSRGLGRGGGK